MSIKNYTAQYTKQLRVPSKYNGFFLAKVRNLSKIRTCIEFTQNFYLEDKKSLIAWEDGCSVFVGFFTTKK